MQARKVIFGVPEWNIGGPCIFAQRLLRGLTALGWDTRVLLTETNTSLVESKPTLLPRPMDIRFDELPVGYNDSWGLRWEALIRYLEENAPCIYIMCHDWRNNVVAPRLSDRVQIIGLVQADYELEYRQAVSLGSYWNAIVAVSDTIQFTLADRMPVLASRLVTIRNAVPSIPVIPEKETTGPLRIVYTGELRYDQKRLGDLAQVALALATNGVDFELTFIGDGPYRSELEQQLLPLIEQGKVRFHGRIPNVELLDELSKYHVFILTSQFEGLSLSLLEAMSRGCVPVVSRLATQSLVVQDGSSGFCVPIGDIAGFTDRITRLANNRSLLSRMAKSAFQMIVDGGYRVEDMVASYVALFDRIERMIQDQRYARPRAWLVAPPRQIGSVNILPCDTSGDVKYVNELAVWPNPHPPLVSKTPRNRARVKPPIKLEDYRVLFAIPFGQISGVDVFSGHMVRALSKRGVESAIVGYRHHDHVLGLDVADDIPVEEPPIDYSETAQMRWEAMIEFLESLSPCIYVPNYNFEFSGVVPRLSDSIKVVSIAHSDDPQHYEHVARLGWVSDAIIGVSAAITQHLKNLDPTFEPRLSTIPYGVSAEPLPPFRAFRTPEDPLKIVFTGRLMQHQKRVADLIEIATALDARNVPFELTIVGNGPERDVLMNSGHRLILKKAIWMPGKMTNEEVGNYLKETDVFLLPSSFEGLSVGLLEAMSQGVVPVVSNMRSGVPELIRHNENGMIVRMGDYAGYADALEYLQKNPERCRQMSAEAHRTIREDGYLLDDMVERYVEVFDSIISQQFNRPHGPIRPPQWMRKDQRWQLQAAYNLKHPAYALKRFRRKID